MSHALRCGFQCSLIFISIFLVSGQKHMQKFFKHLNAGEMSIWRFCRSESLVCRKAFTLRAGSLHHLLRAYLIRMKKVIIHFSSHTFMPCQYLWLWRHSWQSLGNIYFSFHIHLNASILCQSHPQSHVTRAFTTLFDCAAAASLDSRERGTTVQFHTLTAYQGKPKLLFIGD